MPRKKRITTEEFLDEDERRPPPESIDTRFIEEEETLQNIVGQFGPGDVRVKVYRRSPGGGGRDFVFAESGMVTEETLQDYGAGKYDLDIYINDVFRKRLSLGIASRSNVAVNPGGDGGSRFLEQQLHIMREEIRALRQQPQSSALELAQAVRALKEVTGNEPSGGGAVETLKLAMEIAKMIKGVPDEDNSFMGTLKDVVKEVGAPLVKTFLDSRAGPSPNGGMALPAGDPVEAMLRQGIAFLKKRALVNADPGLYVDLLVDNAEDERSRYVISAALTQEFEFFTKFDPELGQAPYLEFFRAVYDGLRSAFKPPDPVAIPGGRAAGDISDVAADAKPRKSGGK